MSEKQALADVYAALLGTGDSGADFCHLPVDTLKDALLDHFKPEHMEALFKEAFIRGIKYALYQQKYHNQPLSEDDFLGPTGLISQQFDWDEEMLDWD